MEVFVSLVFQDFTKEQVTVYPALRHTLIVYHVLNTIVGSASLDISLLSNQAHTIYLRLKMGSQHQSPDAYHAQFMAANIAVIESIQKVFLV